MTDKEIVKALQLEVRAYDKVHDELIKLAKRYNAKHEKKVKAKEDKLNQLIGDFRTEAEAHEAYGYDLISWEEYETICAALEGNKEKADVDDVEIVMSRIFLHLANNTLKMYQTLKYESLSDEEKVEWDRQTAEYKSRIEALKTKKAEQVLEDRDGSIS